LSSSSTARKKHWELMNIPALPSQGAGQLVGRLGVETQNKKTEDSIRVKLVYALKYEILKKGRRKRKKKYKGEVRPIT
jgi:hypothetical protein